MRYKITIEYDGTNYNGWQKQEGEFSIQESLEKAIELFSNEKVEVFGAGRTDAGVHALGQVAHFDLSKEFQLFKVISAINFYLKYKTLANAILSNFDKNIKIQDISVIDCEIVDENFHARFSAKKRFYRYRILNRREPTAIDFNRVWHIPTKLNFEKMQETLPFLIGKKDWSSFRDSECQAKSPIKTIDKVNLYKNENEIIFEIEAKSFMHHMVRNIVGTIVEVGLNKISIQDFQNIIDAKDRTKAGPTAPACGLYFLKVEY